MNTCNCGACHPETLSPLPRDKWVVGKRVKFWYHSPDYKREDGQLVEVWREPTLRYGVIVECEAESVLRGGNDGIFIGITDNAPFNTPRTFWAWDFMIESGIGYQSPIVEA